MGVSVGVCTCGSVGVCVWVVGVCVWVYVRVRVTLMRLYLKTSATDANVSSPAETFLKFFFAHFNFDPKIGS